MKALGRARVARGAAVDVLGGLDSSPDFSTPIDDPPSSPELRPYQVAAVAGVRERFAAGDRATLLVLPTGTGKTVVFAEVARRVVARGRRVLVLAHRRELLEQAIGKLAAAGVRAELEQGPARAGDAPVVVASVATLRGPRLASWARDAFALVVVDEAHHATATSYRAILDHFAPARALGVTATPDRADGAGLGAVFESVAFRFDVATAIREGWLAAIRGRRINLEGLDLDRVRTVAGDLDRTELATIMTAPGRGRRHRSRDRLGGWRAPVRRVHGRRGPRDRAGRRDQRQPPWHGARGVGPLER